MRGKGGGSDFLGSFQSLEEGAREKERRIFFGEGVRIFERKRVPLDFKGGWRRTQKGWKNQVASFLVF